MRVLLDESLPVRLGREIAGHDVTTVRGQGWQGLKNGELLQRAQDAGFDVFITADQNIQYQQNLQRSRLGILIIVAKTNSIEDLIPLVPTILRAIAQIQPGRIKRVSLWFACKETESGIEVNVGGRAKLVAKGQLV